MEPVKGEIVRDDSIVRENTGFSEEPLHYPSLSAIQSNSIPFNLVAALDLSDVSVELGQRSVARLRVPFETLCTLLGEGPRKTHGSSLHLLFLRIEEQLGILRCSQDALLPGENPLRH